jgi:hypothetical protein
MNPLAFAPGRAPRWRSVHAHRAERWLGAELADKLQASSHYWPVPVAGVPGDKLLAYRGDLIGAMPRGAFASLSDYLVDAAAQRARAARSLWRAIGRTRWLAMGFASLGDLISEATTGGKSQRLQWTKTGTTGVVGGMNSLARVGPWPAGQATAAAFAAGESPLDSTAGLGYPFTNAAGGDTMHVVSIGAIATVASQLLLLYDRFYQGNWVLTADTTVSGVPSRYQSADAYGCVISAEVSTVLGATTTTFIPTYMDQDGNTAEVAPASPAFVTASPVNQFPHVGPAWFYQLASADVGVRKLTNLDILSAAPSGNLNVFLAKPLVFVPLPALANLPVSYSLVNDLFNLPRVFDDACLCWLELQKSATTLTSYNMHAVLVSG